jgi:WD40 repeat protein
VGIRSLKLRLVLLQLIIALVALPNNSGIKAHATENCRITLGRGIASSLDWSQVNDVLAVGSTTGIWLFNLDLEEIGQIAAQESMSRVAWSPVEDRLASLSVEGQLTIWSQAAGQYSGKSLYSQQTLVDFSWSPDGTKMALRNQEGQARILSVATGEELFFIDSGDSLLWIDNERLIVGTKTQGVIWNIRTGVNEVALSSNEDTTQGNWDILAMLPNSQLLVAGRQPDIIQQWDINTEQLIESFPYTGDELVLIEDMRMTPHRGHIAIQTGTILEASYSYVDILSLEDLQVIAQISHPSGISAMSWSNDGNHLTVLTHSGSVQTWEVGDTLPVKTEQLFSTPITSLLWSKEEKTLVSAGYGDAYPVQLWDGNATDGMHFSPILSFEANQVSDISLQNLRMNQIAIYGQEFIPVEGVFLSQLEIFDTSTRQIDQMVFTTSSTFSPVFVLQDDDHYVTYQNGEVFRIAVNTKEIVGQINVGSVSIVPVIALDWHEKSGRLVLLRHDSSVRETIIEVWGTQEGQLIARDEIPNLTHQVKISPDGEQFALFSADPNTDDHFGQVWNTEVLQPFLDFEADKDSVMSWSEDNQLLAYTTNRDLTFLNTREGRAVYTTNHYAGISSVTWLSGTNSFAYGTFQGTICMIDAAS